MKNKPVVIRISYEARTRIKMRAAKYNMSMMKLVDELSKQDLIK